MAELNTRVYNEYVNALLERIGASQGDSRVFLNHYLSDFYETHVRWCVSGRPQCHELHDDLDKLPQQAFTWICNCEICRKGDMHRLGA